ncbi:MAG: DUF3465 domain-containing protein [Wenzhouxiangella sp.]
MDRRLLERITVLSVLIVLMTGCAREDLPGNEALEAAFAQGRTGVWISGHGSVVRELGGDAATQRFQLRISEDFNIVLVHRVGSAGRIPAERGDILAFLGRYEFHGAGGELGLTHADPAQPGGGGWVEHRGTRFQ